MIVKYFLESEGHSCIEAEDGQEAIDKFMQQNPDVVLMDIVMPIMDGYQSAFWIKKYATDSHVPIIFLTAKHDESSLLKCLECGGDDYLIKPINGTLLKAKIRAHSRTLELTQQIQAKNIELSRVHANLTKEHEMGRHVLSHALQRNLKACPNIRQYMSSMSTFNGDISLTAEHPNGGLYVFLGDFTGHGLSAAIGTIPLSQLFFSMCEKGESITNISAHMNNTLKTFLPEYMFCAATLIHLSARGDCAHIWTGGLPDGYIVRRGQGIVQNIKSNNMPLGILSADEFNSEPSFYRFEKEDKLVLLSDGILEAINPVSKEMFGASRLLDVINTSEQDLFSAIVGAYKLYVGGEDQQDDISLIEINAVPYEPEVIRVANVVQGEASSFLPWYFCLSVNSQHIREMDVVNHVVSLLPASIRISDNFDRFRTVFAELFSNALEHSLLGLSSIIKEGHEGFVHYYKERENRLLQLENGAIEITISTYLSEDKTKIKVKLEDNGDGFDVNSVKANSFDLNQTWGRGIALVRSLSEELRYSNQGRVVEAIISVE